jgi:DNA repair exonuclease SbcCD ATPase subunit
MDIDSVSTKINYDVENDNQINTLLEECKLEAKNFANREVKIENENCPSCGQKLPEDKIKDTLETLKKQHDNRIEEYKAQINSYHLNIEKLQQQIEEGNNLLNELQEKKKEAETKDYSSDIETEKQKEYRVLKEQLEIENENLKKQNKELESKIEEVVKSDVKNVDLTNYISRLNEVNDKLSTTITLSKLEEDIKNKQAELSAKKISKEVNYKKMQEIIAFNNAKAELLKQRVRQYFKMVEFITSETTADGNMIETFKLAYNGIAYEDLNQSMKILLCLDLLMGIQRIKDKHICILIDNGEQITRLPEVDTQLIVTYVKKQDIKKVEVI